jgi:RNA polymerase sigma-70 factor (ECF subfamily)
MSNQNMGRKDAPPELEDALILEAMKGIPLALAAVYDFYARRIYRYFYSRVENSEDADDLTAQTFLSVIEALPRYQHRGHFTAWIFQVARNKAMDFFRRDHSKVQKEANLSGIVFDETLEKVIQGQTVEALRLMIQLLDEDERELLRLRFVVDLSYVEIAELLGRKEDAVRKSVNRIIERLYVRMEAEHVQA